MQELKNPTIDETPSDEEQKEPNVRHIAHPTDPMLCWCGEVGDTPNFRNGEGTHNPTSFTCALCAELLRRFGTDWWWQTHRLHFESKCHVVDDTAFHNCMID